MTYPVRLQLSRRRNFNLQSISQAASGLPAVVVARPSKWGNPYQAGPDGDGDRTYVVGLFRDYLARTEQAQLVADIKSELRGKNLACWCPLEGEPCHADVLLEIANAE